MDIVITIKANVAKDTDIIGVKESIAYALEDKDITVNHIDVSEVDV